MTIERFPSYTELASSPVHPALLAFMEREERAGFFQSPEFLRLIEPVKGFNPVLFVARQANGEVTGALLVMYQRDGGAVKSWFSRRASVWGGPLGDEAAAKALIDALLKDAAGKAIFIEFRNLFGTDHLRQVFEERGFIFRPHLNFLLDLGTEEEAMKKLSSNRRRQIRTSLAAGAEYGPAASDAEVREFYGLLTRLYREKVGKPLPGLDLFMALHTSTSGRVYIVKANGRVVGGSAGTVYKGRAAYQWYICGDNSIPGVQSSVLATWAQIDHSIREGLRVLDFMGAGKPGQGYGVHEFKSRFGGTEVCFGRYEKILNMPLYRLGTVGLKTYQRLSRIVHKPS